MIDVSVVILNHNYANYLPAAIASALRQTHPATEVIVVDDASTDDSRSVIDGFGPAVTAIFHPDNRGQGAAINSGADVATGDVVWFLDADDALLPNACATAAAAFEADRELAKFHTPLAIIDGDGRPSGTTLPADPARLGHGDLTDHVFRFRAHGWPPMSGNAYSAGALSRVLPIPAETYRQAADSYLNEQVVICGTVARSDRPVAAYRRHGTNQFAGQPVTLGWLRTKIERELCSHDRLGTVAGRLGLEGYRPNPADVRDVAFLGYRLASLRLDPGGHPRVDPSRRDRRGSLALAGIWAAVTNRDLGLADRVLRSIWFPVAALLPRRPAIALISWYLPDGPAEPAWRRRRISATPSGPPLIPEPTALDDRAPAGDNHD